MEEKIRKLLNRMHAGNLTPTQVIEEIQKLLGGDPVFRSTDTPTMNLRWKQTYRSGSLTIAQVLEQEVVRAIVPVSGAFDTERVWIPVPIVGQVEK